MLRAVRKLRFFEAANGEPINTLKERLGYYFSNLKYNIISQNEWMNERAYRQAIRQTHLTAEDSDGRIHYCHKDRQIDRYRREQTGVVLQSRKDRCKSIRENCVSSNGYRSRKPECLHTLRLVENMASLKYERLLRDHSETVRN